MLELAEAGDADVADCEVEGGQGLGVRAEGFAGQRADAAFAFVLELGEGVRRQLGEEACKTRIGAIVVHPAVDLDSVE